MPFHKHGHQEDRYELGTGFYPNQGCAVDLWLAQQAGGHRDLWRLIDRFDGGAFTIAAVDPVCPRCG